MRIQRCLVTGLLFGMAGVAAGAEEPKGEFKPPAAEAAKKKEKEPREVPPPKVTRGTVTLPGGRVLEYKAEAGVLQLEDEKEEPQASIFSVAYQVEPEAGKERPVMFCFNGGPGSSAVWLHLGLLGPRRVDLPGDGTESPRPPYRVVENAETLLGASDLVFVDPVSTGYSRAAEEKSVSATRRSKIFS